MSLEEFLCQHFPGMNVVHLELFIVCDNIENHVKLLKDFQRYHSKILLPSSGDNDATFREILLPSLVSKKLLTCFFTSNLPQNF